MLSFCFPLFASHSLTVRSQLALASVRPSGENASPRTGLLCPLSVLHGMGLSVGGSFPAISQSRICASCPALARIFPFGLQATRKMGPLCSSKVWSNAPLELSQTRVCPSVPPLTRARPSGENANPMIASTTGLVQSRAPFEVSQSSITPSQLPVARCCSSGLNPMADRTL
jgi:hypothetical protein